MKKALFVAAYLLFTSLSAQTITSNFDTNNEGWQTRDYPSGVAPNQSYRATGGNPSGHISAKDGFPLPGSTVYFVAPSKFLGKKSWAYNNTLSFDLKIESGNFFYEDDVILEGNGITLAYDMPNNPTNSWTTFSCTLNETSGWKVGTRLGATATKAQIQSVLCDLTKLWIRGEFFSNFLTADEGFLDNVRLTVTPCTLNVLNQTKTICSGQNVVFNGKTYNTAGVFTDTIKRCYPQCDSVINLNLTVVDAFRTTQNSTICAGNSIKIGVKTYNQTGIYKDTLKTSGNCDSIITTNLTVLAPITKSQNLTICDVDFILINNKRYTQAGIYRDTFKTADNCDSVLITNLTVNKSYTSGQNVAICPNSSYTIGTNTYTRAGIYTDVLKTINNCDSIITTTLSIKSSSERTQKISLCAGLNYAINGKNYAQTGIFRDTFRTLQGCDSIVITDLIINPVYSKNQSFSICQGDLIRVGNRTYNQTGVYRDTLKSITNCDSILITNLTILPPITKTQNLTICEGDFVRINGKNYTQTGIYKDTLKTISGNCDSILTTNLVVNKAFNRSQNVAICPNSFYSINNKSYAQAGIYKDTLKTITNCDSIVTTTLTLLNTTSRTQKISLCSGQLFAINGKNYAQTGIFRDTFRNFQGCDSVVITDLTINSVYSKNQSFSICQGDLIRVGTRTYNQTGIYRDTLKSITNCDSILITNLTILPPITKTQNLTICEGDFVRINNKNYTQTGIYKDTLKTISGNCDSILTTNLVVNKTFNRSQNVAICTNSFYAINNKTYAQAGVYKDTLKTIANCDSIVTTNLTILGPLSITSNFSVCAGDFIKIGVKMYNKAGIYRDTLRTVNGCDSILITNLTIKPERKRTIDTTICEGKTLVINAKTYQKAGSFSDTIRLNGQCDSVLLIALKIKPYPIIKKNVVLCANDSAVINGRLFTKTGVFRDTVNAAINAPNSCSEVIEWTVTKSNLQLDMGNDRLIELGDSIQLDPSVFGAQNVLWTWQTSKLLSCLNCPKPIAKPLQTTIFALTVTDTTTKCVAKNAIKISVKPCVSVFIPTAFTPNNDGVNDYFSVFASGCVQKVTKMQLFNRWGVMVFSKTNFVANNEKEGWDGMMNNTQLPADVYIYVIELALGDGKTKVFSGDVTLVR